MKQSQLNLLQKIYDFEQNNTEPFSIPCSDVSKYDIDFLKREGYIVEPFKAMGAYHLSLTEKGESHLLNGHQVSSEATTNFNFNGVTFTNSIVGTNISGTNYTQNTGASFSELKELIAQKDLADQEQLNQLFALLKSVEQTNQPVKKGVLIQFSNLLNKYSDLIVPVGKILIGIFSQQ